MLARLYSSPLQWFRTASPWRWLQQTPMTEDTIRPFPNGPGSTMITTNRGRPVRVRHITPADDELLVELYHRLSERTRWLRFFQHPVNVSDELIWREAVRLSHLDTLHHAALIALVPESGVEVAVGVARLARSSDELDTAEIAIVVRDDYQGEGLGSALVDLVVQVGLISGLRRIRAYSLEENTAVQKIIANSGFAVSTDTRHGETTQILTLRED